MKTHSETVSFRADTDLLKQIDAECRRFGLSRGSWVRGVIIAHTLRDETPGNGSVPEELQRSIDRLHQRLEEIRTSLARTALMMLTKVGDMPTDEAQKLVRSKLLSREDA